MQEVLPIHSVRIPKFCELTSYTDKAVRRKIEDGVWLEGHEYHRSRTGEITIFLPGYERFARGLPRVASTNLAEGHHGATSNVQR